MPDTMGDMDIAFPNLGIYLKNVPKSFEIFGFRIALYGVIIGIGVLAGVLLAAHIAKKTGQDADSYWDLAIYLVIFSIMGARAYYVIFAWDYYKDNLLGIFNIRNGGLAIYGGVIAGFITLAFYVRRHKKSYRLMADTGVFGLILGQIIGRWGNFTNREVFGQYTNNLFAMRIPTSAVRERDISGSIIAHTTDGTNFIQVHPTFLYESVCNLILLVIMLVYLKHRKFHGEICLMYLGGYGIIRFFVEGIRTDRLLIEGTNIAVSQLLGICLFVGALITDIIVRVILKKRGSRFESDIKYEENEKLLLEVKAAREEALKEK